MALILTKHAQEKIAREGFDLSWIEATITAPERTAPDPDDPTLTRAWRRIPQRGGRVLRVVFRPAGADVVVVSVFLDRGAKRWLPT